MSNFESYGLPSEIVKRLTSMSIATPTPVQERAIPAALAGGDLLVSAQTGTGKTLAYLLPILSKIQDKGHEQVLILAPTRELAAQIQNALVSLLERKQQHDVVLLIGGAPIFKQFLALKRNPRFIIGTPGRIIDHLERGKLVLNNVRYLVLDEVDRMLDMGFSEDIEVILKGVPTERQTLMFSATMPTYIIKLSKKYLQNPENISIGTANQAAVKIKQEMVKCSAGERYAHLLNELKAREGSVIIFVKTKVSADVLAEKLQDKDHHAVAIHGDLRQRRREAVIRSFRKGANRILVATDVAARGLDIPHIRHVINYDLPQCAEDYIHRIGRTGRAGNEGFALSYVLPNEGGKWKVISRVLSSGEITGQPNQRSSGRSSERSSARPSQSRSRNKSTGHPKERERSFSRSGKSAAGSGSGGGRNRKRSDNGANAGAAKGYFSKGKGKPRERNTTVS